jgi:hypothetical protein
VMARANGSISGAVNPAGRWRSSVGTAVVMSLLGEARILTVRGPGVQACCCYI